ncbi:NCA2 family protein [Aspergillus saccharolyticus JOP 1030-1]|uniref:NCA2-domain-containing protein n=1 Tax=Aspergillus saccharolyticus JOP 1030-1 TaxID=1450539 RepID=A0A318ZK99_9EURO|nr:NCA2-domain-containing protein [Aspergillus saccharolyticus JOP 1030-1]PYH47277.1 NCA2-domain-containing protein [Aspergillus saccharolyticus JOP 1030-1]
MFVVNDKINNLDIQLHTLQQRITNSSVIEFPENHSDASTLHSTESLERLSELLSVASKSNPLMSANRVARLISYFPKNPAISCGTSPELPPHRSAISDLAWIAATRASIQTYGITLKTLSENTLVFVDEATYWDSLLESQWYVGLYTLQTSPVWLWHRLGRQFSARSYPGAWNQASHISPSWIHLYDSARRCVSSITVSTLRKSLVYPLLASKLHIRQQRKLLHVVKDINASALGILMDRCFQFELDNELEECYSGGTLSDDWCTNVLKSVTWLELVLRHLLAGTLHDFETRITVTSEEEGSLLSMHLDQNMRSRGPEYVIEKLEHIHRTLIPQYNALTKSNDSELGRPPFIVRYWLVFFLATLSTSTVLEIFTARRRELVRLVTDAGSTTIEFWNNWVIDPLRRLVRTIRHDEKSEIALMSKNSLEADRASLERMVVDFVLDHRKSSDESLVSAEIGTITAKVREGDLTPVLRAYEKDLRTPFIGTVRGDLIRTLLIQIQKTKVDVEVAIGGIDALLKSQELVFGFVGLTPGLLVSYASIRWLLGLFGSRKGLRIGRRQHALRHALRQVHRNLTLSTMSTRGTLSFKDYGLLICNTEVLLQKAQAILGGADFHAFREDIKDIISKNSAKQQLKVIERMGWVYSRWL